MLVESCKFRCHPQCLANFNVRSTRKLVALKGLLEPTNPRGSAWKDLLTDIMKIILQEKECIHGVTTILCISLFLCLKQSKYQMRKQRTNNGKHSRKYRHGSWRKSETKKK